MNKEGGIGTYSSPNESLDRVKEEERGGSSTLFISGNRDKEFSFKDNSWCDKMR